MREWWKLL